MSSLGRGTINQTFIWGGGESGDGDTTGEALSLFCGVEYGVLEVPCAWVSWCVVHGSPQIEFLSLY